MGKFDLKYDISKEGSVCCRVGCKEPTFKVRSSGRGKVIWLCKKHDDEFKEMKRRAKYKLYRNTCGIKYDVKPIVTIKSLCDTYGAPEKFANLCNQYIRENL